MNNISTFITRIIAALMSFFYMLIGGNMNNIDVKLVNQPTSDSTFIEYEVTNYSGKTVYISKYFSIEEKVGNDWVTLPFSEDASTEDIAVGLLNCQSVTLKIDLEQKYGRKLSKGEYRLVLPFTQAPLDFSVE